MTEQISNRTNICAPTQYVAVCPWWTGAGISRVITRYGDFMRYVGYVLLRIYLLRGWVNTDSAARDIFRHIRPAVSPLANVRPIRRLAMDRETHERRLRYGRKRRTAQSGRLAQEPRLQPSRGHHGQREDFLRGRSEPGIRVRSLRDAGPHSKHRRTKT